jgi:peptidoglycan hydrolase-like protein with peptidoglycan-binding domain
MKQNVKMAIIIAIIIFVPLGSVAILLLLKKKKQDDSKTDSTTNTVASEASVYPLKLGSRGSLVGSLQTKLNGLLNQASLAKLKLPTYNAVTITSLSVDNIFGPKTLAVVRWHFGTDTVTQTQYKTL